MPSEVARRSEQRTQEEQKLAHTLLIEILAYAMALKMIYSYPTDTGIAINLRHRSDGTWYLCTEDAARKSDGLNNRFARIETQDTFFSGSSSVERYIEIGSANILGTMAKRTIASKYAASDRFGSLHRQILSFADNMKEFYSIYAEEALTSPDPGSTAADKQSSSSNPNSKESWTPHTAEASPLVASASSVPVKIADTAINPLHIIRSVVANKLKKSFEEVNVGVSIKDLASGKHTALGYYFWMLRYI